MFYLLPVGTVERNDQQLSGLEEGCLVSGGGAFFLLLLLSDARTAPLGITLFAAATFFALRRSSQQQPAPQQRSGVRRALGVGVALALLVCFGLYPLFADGVGLFAQLLRLLRSSTLRFVVAFLAMQLGFVYSQRHTANRKREDAPALGPKLAAELLKLRAMTQAATAEELLPTEVRLTGTLDTHGAYVSVPFHRCADPNCSSCKTADKVPCEFSVGISLLGANIPFSLRPQSMLDPLLESKPEIHLGVADVDNNWWIQGDLAMARAVFSKEVCAALSALSAAQEAQGRKKLSFEVRNGHLVCDTFGIPTELFPHLRAVLVSMQQALLAYLESHPTTEGVYRVETVPLRVAIDQLISSQSSEDESSALEATKQSPRARSGAT